MSANLGNWYLQDVDLASVKSCVCRMLLFEGRSALVKKTNVECFWAELAFFDNFVWVISGTAGPDIWQLGLIDFLPKNN